MSLRDTKLVNNFEDCLILALSQKSLKEFEAFENLLVYVWQQFFVIGAVPVTRS